MKTKLIYSLAIALAVTLAATGCKHKPVGLTNLPQGMTPPLPETQPGNTLPYIQPENPNKEGIAQADINTRYGMIPDPAALAANTIHFAYDSAAIRGSEHANLQSVAQALAADPKTKLVVEGNCDERGTEEYNRSLGERRALAAREALVKLGVDSSRIFTESFGKDKPVDPGHDEAAWKQNRRDDFVLLHPKPGM